MATAAIREPAVAGTFYPADARVLASAVDALLGERPQQQFPVRAMVVPHAGYAYSGAIAAAAFRRLGSRRSRAFVIGPSHVEAFNFTSIFDGEFYRTPLGDIAVDDEAAEALARAHPSIRRSRTGHVLGRGERGEHAIEVELPFLQRMIPDIRIVPITMGSQSWDECEALGNAIRGLADWDQDVLIASSDLSHFYADDRARQLDGMFCASLAAMDAATLYRRLERGDCEACGGGPVVTALLATSGLRARECEIVASGNSGDVSGDRSRVVGYVSAVITGVTTR